MHQKLTFQQKCFLAILHPITAVKLTLTHHMHKLNLNFLQSFFFYFTSLESLYFAKEHKQAPPPPAIQPLFSSILTAQSDAFSIQKHTAQSVQLDQLKAEVVAVGDCSIVELCEFVVKIHEIDDLVEGNFSQKGIQMVALLHAFTK
ncbi:hypothetical protein SS50377_27562 [Spironucleus salmonicida]|uniref:Uncharacterized protein n=1 Tax=Spironucleus salmonicida TaxID=348837 RepID=V6LQ08_9EUKA|nr:hypothetical protein SS50377_27562 [Spironucleus salmonicida]|eukprot:EST46660.1 Hypothetical protein SS50377_13465 [Spironucleus salmonicida]